MAKILVSPQSAFIPIIKELVKRNHSIVTIEPNFKQTLTDLDIPATALMDYIGHETQLNAFRNASEIIHQTFSPFDTGNLNSKIIEWLETNLAAYAYPKVSDLTLFAEAINSLSPDAIILHNDVEPLTRAAAQWASHNNKPCFHIPHANYQEVENDGLDIHHIITANHILSSGPYQTRWYDQRLKVEQNKKSKVKIIETGLPQFDEWARLELNPQLARTSLGLGFDKPVITYCSSWRQNTNMAGMHDGVEETYLAMLEVVKSMTDVQFIIKCHPRGNNAQWHVDKAKEQGITNLLITPHHLLPILQASDIVFAYGPSNVLLEASHIPWLRLACTSGYEDDYQIVKINTDPPDTKHIETYLYEMLEKPPYDLTDFRQKYIGRCDGLNYIRIVKVIEKVLENGTSQNIDNGKTAITETIQETS